MKNEKQRNVKDTLICQDFPLKSGSLSRAIFFSLPRQSSQVKGQKVFVWSYETSLYRCAGKGCDEKKAIQSEATDTKHALSASANRWLLVECYASVAAVDTHIDRMFSVSQQPRAFYNCQRSQLDTLTLCLTSMHSFNTAARHSFIYAEHTHTHLLAHIYCRSPPAPWHYTSVQPECAEGEWKLQKQRWKWVKAIEDEWN